MIRFVFLLSGLCLVFVLFLLFIAFDNGWAHLNDATTWAWLFITGILSGIVIWTWITRNQD